MESEVVDTVKQTLGDVHLLETTLLGYKDSNQMLIFDRLNNVVADLAKMQTAADKCDIQVPVEVIELIDEGRNPDLFTRDFFQGIMKKNQMSKGRVEAFKTLRGSYLEELDKVFPKTTDAYRTLQLASVNAACRANEETPAGLSNGGPKSGPGSDAAPTARPPVANTSAKNV